jgi:hypothetical protein
MKFLKMQHTTGAEGRILRYWKLALVKIYTSLTISDPAGRADLIFVMAGRMERKQYGLKLFRDGVAPVLVLSIGRYEVSRMSDVDLEGFTELKALRDRTSPAERRFFMTVKADGVQVENVHLPRWSTYGEALALREFLGKVSGRRLVIVSTDVHLRRVKLTLDKVFRHLPAHFSYCSVPSLMTTLRPDTWWTHRDSRRFVLKELLKLAGYRVILSMPAWASRRFMRLKED